MRSPTLPMRNYVEAAIHAAGQPPARFAVHAIGLVYRGGPMQRTIAAPLLTVRHFHKIRLPAVTARNTSTGAVFTATADSDVTYFLRNPPVAVKPRLALVQAKM